MPSVQQQGLGRFACPSGPPCQRVCRERHGGRGARVITSFFTERLVDHVVLTVAPVVLGGMRAVKPMEGAYPEFPRLANTGYKKVGDDMVIWGDPVWDRPLEG